MTAKKLTIATVIAAGSSGMYASEKDYAKLLKDGLIEVNTSMVNEAGEHAIRAVVKEEVKEEIKEPVKEEVKGFTLESGIAVPAASRRGGGGRSSKYPFDAMEVGQSFFVAGDDEILKKMSSTASSATSRFAVPDPTGATKPNRSGELVPLMVKTRVFVARAVEGGARIWRTA